MEKIYSTEEGESEDEVEGVIAHPDDHQMSEDEANLFRQQVEKRTLQEERRTLHKEADVLESLPEGVFAASFLRQAELDFQKAEINTKIQEYLLSLPEEERIEAFARAKQEGYPLHLLVPDDRLEGNTIVEGPRTLQ